MPCCISESLVRRGFSSDGRGLSSDWALAPKAAQVDFPPPTPEIRSRSLRDALAPPCSTPQLSFQWLRHASRPSIPCRVKFLQLFLDSDRNHVVICYWILNRHARHYVPAPSVPFSIRRTAFRVPSLLSVLKPLAPLLFSCTYELQISQLLSFHNHTECRGVYPTRTLLLAFFPARASRSPCLTLSSSAD